MKSDAKSIPDVISEEIKKLQGTWISLLPKSLDADYKKAEHFVVRVGRE